MNYGTVAQRLAQETFNLLVVGSNPTSPTNFKDLPMFGPIWLSIFNFIAFAILVLGDKPPRMLKWSDKRAIYCIIFSIIGILGYVVGIILHIP